MTICSVQAPTVTFQPTMEIAFFCRTSQNSNKHQTSSNYPLCASIKYDHPTYLSFQLQFSYHNSNHQQMSHFFIKIYPYMLFFISLLYNMQKERQEEEREEQLPSKIKKDGKVRTTKKKPQTLREITHYFVKVDKPAPVNKNIPTPDKAAIQEMDRALNTLQQEENQLLQRLQEAKLRSERQKDEREHFFNKSRNLISAELKKISEVNRFFKRQNQMKFKEKEHQLNKIKEEISNKTEAVNSGKLNPFQKYFTLRQIRKAQEEHSRLSTEVYLLSQSHRIALQEQSCYFAKQNWPILMKRYQPLQLIGKGGFSEVYKSYDLYTNETVAIKLSSVEHLLQGSGSKHEYLKHIKRQYQIHKLLNHSNIVKLIQVIELQSAICIVLQYCQGYTLTQYLKLQGVIAQNQAKMIIRQIANVVHYLSSQVPAIIHYDLKPQNIIFNKGMIKVLDFGICKIFDSEHSKMALTSQGVGTFYYLPPETFVQNNPVVSNKVDIWSLGIIFYEMLYGNRPFGQNTSQPYFCGVDLDSKDLFNDPKNISELGKRFLLDCLLKNPSQRLDPLLILNHHYLEEKA